MSGINIISCVCALFGMHTLLNHPEKDPLEVHLGISALALIGSFSALCVQACNLVNLFNLVLVATLPALIAIFTIFFDMQTNVTFENETLRKFLTTFGYKKENSKKEN